MSEISTRRGGGGAGAGAAATAGGTNDAPVVVRTDLAALLSDYTNSQRRYNNRLESLEREMASLKGQVNHVFVPTEEHELNRTYTTKKASVSPSTSARVPSPSRIPLPITPRKSSTDDKSSLSPNGNTAISRPLPTAPPMARSKTFHHSPPSSSPSNFSEETNLLRAYKMHLEQTLHKDSRMPNYTSMEDVIKANEQLLVENDRLRSELSRLKTESILLVRSMKSAGMESNSGNERIIAERERQELAAELARQVEENKRLRKSLLAQSTKFLSLRQSSNLDASLSASIENRLTPISAPQSVPNSGRIAKSKSARFNMNNRTVVRAKSFHQESNEPS